MLFVQFIYRDHVKGGPPSHPEKGRLGAFLNIIFTMVGESIKTSLWKTFMLPLHYLMIVQRKQLVIARVSYIYWFLIEYY